MITLKMKKKWIGILEIIILVFLDQITKYWAVVNLKNGNPIEVITGVFSLQYLENFGAAFGVLQNATAFFIILTIILLMGFIFVSMKLPDDGRYKPIRYLLIFFIAGAIGNFIDRIAHTYVIDFLYFKLINFPIFNVADIYVTCSCIAFGILVLFYYKEEDFDFLKKGR